ncbi:MAG: hypothetical protein RLZZ219_1671, partial [Cyanobacteriota bacterium]
MAASSVPRPPAPRPTGRQRPAEIAWSGSPQDLQALAQRSDWSQITGLEQLWPVLAERHGDGLALDAPHGRPPE